MHLRTNPSEHGFRIIAVWFVLQVEIADIKRVYSLFVDVKRSTQFLMEYQKVS